MGSFPRTRPSELVDRTVLPLRVGPLTARVTCPRCGSPHIVPARRDALSDEISALRGGSATSDFATGDFDHWFCSACGQGWPHAHPTSMRTTQELAPVVEPVGAADFVEELLDPGDLSIAREVRTASPFIDPAVPSTRRRPRRWKAAAIALVLLAAVVASVVWFAPFGRDHAGAPADAAATHAPSDGHRSALKGIHAVLRLTEPTWVRAVGDGTVLERSEQKPGHPIVLHSRKVLRLILGNGGAVELRMNGERVKTGPAGQSISLTFVRRSGAVITRTA